MWNFNFIVYFYYYFFFFNIFKFQKCFENFMKVSYPWIMDFMPACLGKVTLSQILDYNN